MAGLPNNLNTQLPNSGMNLPQNTNAALNAKDQELIKQHNLKKPPLTPKRAVRNLFNLTEMLLAAPLLANSLVLQADNIAEQGLDQDLKELGSVGYVASAYKSMASAFKWGLNKFIVKDRSAEEIGSNQSANLKQNFVERFMHPNITKEFTSLLFNVRRIVFNFFPNTFTVPSAEHDPLHPDSNFSKPSTVKANIILASLTGPLRFTASLVSAVTTIPSHLLGSYFSYTGNEEAYKATKYFNKVSELFTPMLANLSSTLSVAKAYLKSFVGDEANKNGISKFVTFGSYNINKANIAQAFLGSITAIPYFAGIAGKFRDVVRERDHNQEFKLSKNLTTLAQNIVPSLERIGWILKKEQSRCWQTLSKVLRREWKDIEALTKNFLSSLFNSNASLKSFAGKFRPTDGAGNIQAIADNYSVDPKQRQDKYSIGLVKKSNFFKEVFDWLHPIQSMLMLLPNALVPPKDNYIEDNSKTTGRRLDRLFGLNSMLLSFPNYVIYGASTRLPQLFLKAFEYQERKHELAREKYFVENGIALEELDTYGDIPDLGVMDGMQLKEKAVETLRKIPFFGMAFLASKIEALEFDKKILQDEDLFRIEYEKLDKSAREQEASVKASELVTATRIGFRTLLERRNKLFFAERGPDGFTNEEQSRLKFYKSVGNFKNIVGKIPVLGWVAAPILEGFRSFYKVDATGRRSAIVNKPLPADLAKIAQQMQGAQGANASLAA